MHSTRGRRLIFDCLPRPSPVKILKSVRTIFLNLLTFILKQIESKFGGMNPFCINLKKDHPTFLHFVCIICYSIYCIYSLPYLFLDFLG